MRDLADMHGVSEAVLWGMKVDHNWFGSEILCRWVGSPRLSGGFCIRWILIKCIRRGLCDVRPWVVFEFEF